MCNSNTSLPDNFACLNVFLLVLFFRMPVTGCRSTGWSTVTAASSTWMMYSATWPMTKTGWVMFGRDTSGCENTDEAKHVLSGLPINLNCISNMCWQCISYILCLPASSHEWRVSGIRNKGLHGLEKYLSVPWCKNTRVALCCFPRQRKCFLTSRIRELLV